MSVDVSRALLAWYAVDKRTLPWRYGDGERPDPYRVWLSEIMLQQTTVAAVKPYFGAFTARWPTVEALAAADEAEVMRAWAGLGYYARARNLVACARMVARELAGRFPEDEAGLLKLPGVGAYTAAAIAAIAFGRRAVVVDGNVERVVSRLFAVAEPLPGAKGRLRTLADRLTPDADCGDFAQAMMDLGATICTPRSPDCGHCPVAAWCAARAEGRPEAYPVKLKKAAKQEREWTGYWLTRGDAVLLVRRPPKGLLGGMLALPVEAPVAADWREIGAVSHVFTHFALTMRVVAAELEEGPARVETLASVSSAPAFAGAQSGDAGVRGPAQAGPVASISCAPACAGARSGDVDGCGPAQAGAVASISCAPAFAEAQSGGVEAEGEAFAWWPMARIGEAGLPTVFAKAAVLGVAAREREGD